MTSARERAYQALLEALRAGLPMPVLRDEPEPAQAEQPECRLRSGAAEVVDETMSPRWFAFEDPAILELYLQDDWQGARAAFIDDWVAAVERALADPTLGGAIDHLETSPPVVDLERVEGADPLAAAALTITMSYTSNRRSG